MFDHRSYLIARWLRFSAVVYHRTDNFIDLCAGPTGSRETIRKHEEAAVRHAHLTLVSAVDLADLPKQLGARYEYIPHGVDMERFTDPELTRTRPPEYETLRGPIICFVGSIEKWVDIDLLACVATEQAQWNVCLVGPIAPEVSVLRLSECPNVILTGTVDSLRVPAYIAHADVCLIPFKVGPISNGANPLKLLEYFALGKPVVSTPVPEVSSHGPLVSIAENAHAFIEKIAYHLDHDDGLSGRRVTVAQSRSWESVLRRALSKIESDLFTEYSIDGLSEHHTRVL
jgi:glycosyltransferase involved in cell wall biosynthesis